MGFKVVSRQDFANEGGGNRQADTLTRHTVGAMEMTKRNFLSGTWEDFEAWIRAKVGGEISWKVRPGDTKVNRMIVAQSILEALERNGGEFPCSGNPFLELERDEELP